MDDKHLAEIFRGDGVNPAPYATLVKHQVILLNAIEATTEVLKHIALNPTDGTLLNQAHLALRDYERRTNNQSRRLEDEFNSKLYSNAGLTPTKS